jgi:hypothetical protein
MAPALPEGVNDPGVVALCQSVAEPPKSKELRAKPCASRLYFESIALAIGDRRQRIAMSNSSNLQKARAKAGVVLPRGRWEGHATGVKITDLGTRKPVTQVLIRNAGPRSVFSHEVAWSFSPWRASRGSVGRNQNILSPVGALSEHPDTAPPGLDELISFWGGARQPTAGSPWAK